MKLILISHRGNLNGPDDSMENKLNAIKNALIKGFHVEIDMWLIDGELYLGHDCPDEKIHTDFIRENQDRLWIHAKNHEVFEYLRLEGFRVFWHQEDDFVITTYGDIWAYPGKCNLKNRVEVINGKLDKKEIPNIRGICTDYPLYYMEA